MRLNGAAVHPHVPTRSERVLTVGDVIPEFRLPALAATVGNAWEFDSAWIRGRWVALLYWPKHSCLESPEDVAELVRLSPAFAERDSQFLVACASIDPDRAWPASAAPLHERASLPGGGGRVRGPGRSARHGSGRRPAARPGDVRGRSRRRDPLDERERPPRGADDSRCGRGPRRPAGHGAAADRRHRPSPHPIVRVVPPSPGRRRLA